MCTHPEHNGKSYAGLLMTEIIAEFRARERHLSCMSGKTMRGQLLSMSD